MTMTMSDVMSTDLVTVDSACSSGVAAGLMRERGIGDVLVVDGTRLVGLVTDRDLAVRVLAEGRGPDTSVREACSAPPAVVGPDAPVEHAVTLMREHAVRRLPVVGDDGIPVGVVSLGDLAIERDPASALADISQAPPND